MWKNDLSVSVLRVTVALVSAFVFAMTWFFAYSPERLLAQALFLALFIDGLWPFLEKFDGVVIRTISALAHFAPRIFVFAIICSWVFTGGRELLSTVASQDGWAFVGGVAYVIFYVLFMAVVSLMSLTSIVLPVWEDSFGPKRKSQSDPATSSLTTVSHAFGANPNGTVS